MNASRSYPIRYPPAVEVGGIRLRRSVACATVPAEATPPRGGGLDSMSPKNPVVLVLAEIPVAPTIKAHSIIPVKGEGDLQQGRDGVVAYTSAHVDYVESELVVRGVHSCQNLPATVQEVRRILHQHLKELPPDVILQRDISRGRE